MPDNDLAQRLDQMASQDDIDIKPALRQIMTATAQLVRASDANLQTQAGLSKLREEFDAYKNKVIGVGIGVSLASAVGGGGIVVAITKLINP